MAIDSAIKRRAAASSSSPILPSPSGTIDADARAVLMQSYLLSAITVTVTTPLERIFAITRDQRVFAIMRDIRTYAVGH